MNYGEDPFDRHGIEFEQRQIIRQGRVSPDWADITADLDERERNRTVQTLTRLVFDAENLPASL